MKPIIHQFEYLTNDGAWRIVEHIFWDIEELGKRFCKDDQHRIRNEKFYLADLQELSNEEGKNILKQADELYEQQKENDQKERDLDEFKRLKEKLNL